jgi:hypothetical protein
MLDVPTLPLAHNFFDFSLLLEQLLQKPASKHCSNPPQFYKIKGLLPLFQAAIRVLPSLY